MIRPLFSFLVQIAAISCAVVSCTLVDSADARLDACIGLTSDQINRSITEYVISRRYVSNASYEVEYSLGLADSCRYVLVYKRPENSVISWRYPDKSAERFCRNLHQGI